MQLLSCEHPKLVYNKYTNQYVYAPCGECALCMNRKAAHYTQLLERERLQHPFSFFVTLTYSNENIPYLALDFGKILKHVEYFPSRLHDDFCVPFDSLFPPKLLGEKYDNADIKFFDSWYEDDSPICGLPYASKTDVQLFLKRLNKYAKSHVTGKYKNFRYFIVSEYGSTTFRPHFHAIFFVDNIRFAEKFEDCLSACWKYGIIDCKPVESSACAYVAQYINKSSDLPYVYQNSQIRPFFLCSRCPFIGAFSHNTDIDQEVVNQSAVTTFVHRQRQDTAFVTVPLEKSYQNHLFPKCPLYSVVTDYVRTQFYAISERFRLVTLRGFMNDIFDLISSPCKSEFVTYLRGLLSFKQVYDNELRLERHDPYNMFDEYSFNFLRRLFYFGRKVARQACQFGLTLYGYMAKIIKYYEKKDMYLLNDMYKTQEVSCDNDFDSWLVMYPDYLRSHFGSTVRECIDYLRGIGSMIAPNQLDDSYVKFEKNKKTKKKNDYLESLKLRDESKFLYYLIKSYCYAKKCNETLETIAPSW